MINVTEHNQEIIKRFYEDNRDSIIELKPNKIKLIDKIHKNDKHVSYMAYKLANTMKDEKKKCSICGNEHSKEDIDSFRINQWDGFCHSSEGIYICKDCFEENVKMTEKGMFLTYNGYLYHYKPCCFTRVNSKADIDYIFNKDYYDILDIFQTQNEDRQRKYNYR